RRGAALVSGAACQRAGGRAAGVLETPLSGQLHHAALPRRHARAAADRAADRLDHPSLGESRRRMDFLGEGLHRALQLISSVDPEVYGIALLTVKVAVVATLIACALGMRLAGVRPPRGHVECAGVPPDRPSTLRETPR